MVKDNMYHSPEKVADAAAVATTSIAGWAHLSAANEVMTFVATCIACAVGLATLWFHIERIITLRKTRNEEK